MVAAGSRPRPARGPLPLTAEGFSLLLAIVARVDAVAADRTLLQVGIIAGAGGVDHSGGEVDQVEIPRHGGPGRQRGAVGVMADKTRDAMGSEMRVM